MIVERSSQEDDGETERDEDWSCNEDSVQNSCISLPLQRTRLCYVVQGVHKKAKSPSQRLFLLGAV